MTSKKISETVNKLRCIIMQPFDFNGITINVNYVSRATHGKNWIIDTHYHPWYEFNYVSKGSVYTTIDGKEFLVEDKMSYIIPPGVPHSHRHNNIGDDGICIRFSIDEKDGVNNIRNIMNVLTAPHASTFDSHIEKLNLDGNMYSIQAEFAAWIMRLSHVWEVSDTQIYSDVHMVLSHQVILYLNEYYSTKIKVKDIADALNTSYRSLSRKFKSETGATISDMLAQIRISKAKKLLLTTNLSMYEIAVAVGYENEFYFSKKFKQQEKMPPISYRNNVFK